MKSLVAACTLLAAACGRIDFTELPPRVDAARVEPRCPPGGCVVTHGWSKRFGTSAVDFGFDLAAHGGHVTITGFFAQTVDFGGGPLVAAGFHDAMVVTFDGDGAHVVSRRYGGTGFDEAFGIFVGANGDRFVTARAHSGIDFGGGPLTGAGGYDAAIARVTADDTQVFARLMGGPLDDVAQALVVDEAAGASYIGGTFVQMIDLGDGVVAGAGGEDGFVASYDAVGGHRWSRAWTETGTGPDFVRALALGPGGDVVYASGQCAGDGCVVALDARTGATRWEIRWGGAGDDGSNGVVVDGDGNLYVAGYFADSIELAGATFTSAGDNDLLLFSADPTGSVRWAQRHGGAGRDRAIKLAIGPDGEVVAGGTFEDRATFGDDTLVSMGDRDAFLFAVTGSGTPLWARSFGAAGQDEVHGVGVDASGRVFATGAFSGTVDFGGGALTSAGLIDTFVLRVDPVLERP